MDNWFAPKNMFIIYLTLYCLHKYMINMMSGIKL